MARPLTMRHKRRLVVVTGALLVLGTATYAWTQTQGLFSTSYFWGSNVAVNVIRGTTANYASVVLGTGSSYQSYSEDWTIQTRADNDSGNQFSITRAGMDSSTFVINKSDGKIGIGTTAPKTALNVSKSLSLGGPIIGLTYAGGGASYFGGIQWLNDAGAKGWAIENNMTVGNNNLEFNNGASNRMVLNPSGNLGVGTSNPVAKLHVAGDAQVDGNIGAKYQDVAEWVRSADKPNAGTVVVIDTMDRDRVVSASRAYDTGVAGVVSLRPGVLLGEPAQDRIKVAHSGRVKVKVDASYGSIAPGDLLVTSSTPGHAMRSEPLNVGGASMHRPGTLIGKALEPLTEGQAEILVLLMLQ